MILIYIIDQATGGTYDFFKLSGIKYSYVYELRPASEGEGGFNLDASHIYPSIMETFASFYEFSRLIPA